MAILILKMQRLMVGKFPEVTGLVSCRVKGMNPVLCVSKAPVSNPWALPWAWEIAACPYWLRGMSFLTGGLSDPARCLAQTAL